MERVEPEGDQARPKTCGLCSKKGNTAGDRAMVLNPEHLQVFATRA